MTSGQLVTPCRPRKMSKGAKSHVATSRQRKQQTRYTRQKPKAGRGAKRQSPTEVVVHDAFLAMFWSSESGGAWLVRGGERLGCGCGGQRHSLFAIIYYYNCSFHLQSIDLSNIWTTRLHYPSPIMQLAYR